MGGSDNKTYEWALKGAVTNALGAAWSLMSYQFSVYAGLRSHTDFARGATPRPPQRATQTSAPARAAAPAAARPQTSAYNDPEDLGSIVVKGGSKHPGETLAEIWASDQGFITHWLATDKNNNDWMRERADKFMALMGGGEQKSTDEEQHDFAGANTGHSDLEFAFLEALTLIMPLDEAKEQLRLGQEAGKADAAWLKKSIAYAKQQHQANPFRQEDADPFADGE
jgi:hypothetical protein